MATAQYVVEKICSKRVLKSGQLQYRVKWMNYSAKNNTWEGAENVLQSCSDLVAQFECRTTKRHEDKDTIEDPDRFEVEKILDVRETGNGLEYLIHWQGFDSNWDTWEPLACLDQCLELLQDFEARRSLKATPNGSSRHGHLMQLVFFIDERDRIRHKKDAGCTWPWTTDIILRDYRFCNVRREDDRVSRMLYSIMQPHIEHEYFLANCAIHRLASCWDFSMELQYVTNLPCAIEVAKRRIQQQQPVRTGAFISSFPDKELFKRWNAFWKLSPLWHGFLMSRPSMQNVYSRIKNEIEGFGPFLAWQLTADLVMYGVVPEDSEFVVLGPGAKKGLAFFRGWSFDKLFAELNARLDVKLRKMDLEHVLCEYQKYLRIKRGHRACRKYTPSKDSD